MTGYRESVNMAQVRTFIEMDSHEERVHMAVRQTQEREAKQKMREKAKLLSKAQRTQQLNKGLSNTVGGMGSIGNSSNTIDLKNDAIADRTSPDTGSSYSALSKPRVSLSLHLLIQFFCQTISYKILIDFQTVYTQTSKALKLGSKSHAFSPAQDEQLANELEHGN